MIKTLPLKQLNLTAGTQQRPIDSDVVLKYKELIKDGADFPPVDVVADGQEFFLWDGFHRIEAYKNLKNTSIKCSVEKGTKRNAIQYSFNANISHGFPRQPGTAKKIIEKILADDEWKKWNSSEIARWVGATRQYVIKIRAEVESGRKPKPADENTGSKEKKETTKPKAKTSEKKKRKVKRGDQEYEQEVPAKTIKDSTGQEVPERLAEVFSRTNEIKALIHQLNKVLKAAKDAVEKEDLLWSHHRINPLTVDIGNAKRNLTFTLPYAVCRYCGGEGKGCGACKGLGFMNKLMFTATPEEMK